MHYENFSRHLREKYSTRLHVTDQLVDQLKYKTQLSTSDKNMNKVSFPLTSYLNKFQNNQQKLIDEFEPYLNECLLAAERVKNNRYSNRDRQICYENFILAQKLKQIKNQSGQNTKKDYQNNYRLLISKANCESNAIQSINKRFITKQSLLSNEKNFNEERFSETIINSSSEYEDDQATAADVDASIEYFDSRSSVLDKKQKNRNFNCATQSMSIKCKEIDSSNNQNQKFFQIENDGIYQHLNNIYMRMFQDTIPLSTSQTSRHFSICILPHFDSDSMKNHSKVLSHNRQYAFKKEILYH